MISHINLELFADENENVLCLKSMTFFYHVIVDLQNK